VKPFIEQLASVVPWGSTAAGSPIVAAVRALPQVTAARKPGLEHIKGFEALSQDRGSGWCSATPSGTRR
jgi:hypothetical protein